MKITVIGAGSVAWGPTISTDFLLCPGLDGAELMLMDIDAESLGLVKRLLDRLVAEQGFKKTVKATTDLDEALRDADYVLPAIGVGGDRIWRYDVVFPQVYGVFQPVGDTIGPGGLMRGLRHVPVLMNIGRKMLELSKPGAYMLQLSNPMNTICGALEQIDGLPIYGICHGVDDTEVIFSRQLGIPPSQVHIEAAGNNHNIWCTEITIGDTVYTQDRFDELTPALFDTPFREEAYRRYGGLVANYSRHPIEFLPDFMSPESEYGLKWGVRPIAWEIDPLLGTRRDKTRAVLEAVLAQREPILIRSEPGYFGLRITPEGRAETGHSREIIDDFILALEHGTDFFIHLNLANQSAIEGVAAEYNVEVPCEFKNRVMTRKPVRLNNDAITREINRVGKEQYLLSQACLKFDEELLVESLSMDALVPSRDIAARLVREMVAFEKEYLPMVA